MNDDAFCDEMAARILAEHNAECAEKGMRAGPHLPRLGDAFKYLRGKGLPWQKILAMVGPILAILAGGGSWGAILAAILKLFEPDPAPPPVPTA